MSKMFGKILNCNNAAILQKRKKLKVYDDIVLS